METSALRVEEESELPAPQKEIRVRFAISSSNFKQLSQIHVGLFASFFATQEKGSFILRIDNLKEKESNPSFISDLTDPLKSLQICWTEGPDIGGSFSPYLQSERNSSYQEKLQTLIDQKKAFRCFCTPEKLEEDRRRFLAQGRTPRYTGTCRNLSAQEITSYQEEGKSSLVRLKVDRQIIKFQDLIHGSQSVDSEEIGDFVLQLSNGEITSDFASTVDDISMEITDVFRGDQELANTPRQILIFQSLNSVFPRFAHFPLILGPDRVLLSERQGSVTFVDLKKEGYLPSAILNYFGLLGWTNTPRREILSLEEILKKFDLKNISRSSPLLDWDKLKKINAFYLRELSFSEFSDLCRQLLSNYKEAQNKKGEGWIESTLQLLQHQSKTIGEVGEMIQLLIYPIRSFSDEVQKFFFKDSPKVLKLAKDELVRLNDFNLESIQSYLKDLKEKAKSKAINFYVPLRVALSGKSQGPDLALLLFLLGKEEVIDRIDYAVKNLQHLSAK